MAGKKNTHCGVKKCPSNVSGHRMSVYGIPEDRLIKRKWLKAMKKASFGPSAGVCERHFTGMYWSRKDKSSHNQLNTTISSFIFLDDSFVPKSKNIE